MGYIYILHIIYIYFLITIYNSHYLKCFIVTNRVINWSRISMDFFQPQYGLFLRECMGQIHPHMIRDLDGTNHAMIRLGLGQQHHGEKCLSGGARWHELYFCSGGEHAMAQH